MASSEHGQPGQEPDSLRAEASAESAYARTLGERLRASDARHAQTPEHQRFVQRVLNATRADQGSLNPGLHGDPGLRGDLRLIRSYLGERLAHSPLLRLAAASLLVHLIAVPAVLAYVYLRPQAQEVRLGFEPAPDPQPFEADLPAVPETLEAWDLDALTPLAAGNARAWDAEQLRVAFDAGEVPALDPNRAAADGVEHWLRMRAWQIAGAAGLANGGPTLQELRWAAGPAGSGEVDSDQALRLARLIAVETWLDGIAFGTDLAAELAPVLDLLAQEPPGGTAGLALAQRALQRAQEYGLALPATVAPALASRLAPAGDPPVGDSLPLGPDAPRTGPLAGDWREDLRAAARAAGLPGADALWAPMR